MKLYIKASGDFDLPNKIDKVAKDIISAIDEEKIKVIIENQNDDAELIDYEILKRTDPIGYSTVLFYTDKESGSFGKIVDLSVYKDVTCEQVDDVLLVTVK